MKPKRNPNRVGMGTTAEGLPLVSNATVAVGDEWYLSDGGGSGYKAIPDGAGGKTWLQLAIAAAASAITSYLGGAIVQRRATATSFVADSGGTKDYIIGVTSTAAPRTITLPPAANGRVMVIQDESGGAGTNAITIVPLAGLVNGAASITIAANYGSRGLYSDGTNWFAA